MTVGRLVRYGPARMLFLAPAFLLFGVFVLYPIGGSAWMSLHDVRADRIICSDGREIADLETGEKCRRVQKMEFVGLDNYERFFAKTPQNVQFLRKTNRCLGGLSSRKSRTPDGAGRYNTWKYPTRQPRSLAPRSSAAPLAIFYIIIYSCQLSVIVVRLSYAIIIQALKRAPIGRPAHLVLVDNMQYYLGLVIKACPTMNKACPGRGY